jgi:glyoxylate/hydroxypyruvate reductase A
MLTLLVHLGDRPEQPWADAYAAALPEMRVVTTADRFERAEIDYVFAWKPAADAFAGLTRLKALLSFGAGVDSLLLHPHLPAGVPIVRFVDGGLTQQMADYVIANVGLHQRLMTRFRRDQAARRWVQLYPAAATGCTVGIMGLGVIGAHVARQLQLHGYRVRGWSRSAKSIEGIEAFAGPGQLDAFLSGADVLVNLLPLTPETRGILNYQTFAKLHRGGIDGEGPILINAGRGGHQREADIVRALEDGTLRAASLDVFEVEPLPQQSPLWAMDNVYITPHIAGASSIETGVAYFSRVIRDHEAGRDLPNVIDLARGY